MKIFQMGLSVMIANSNVPSWLDHKAAQELLMEVGDELVLVQKLKNKEKKQ